MQPSSFQSVARRHVAGRVLAGSVGQPAQRPGLSRSGPMPSGYGSGATVPVPLPRRGTTSDPNGAALCRGHGEINETLRTTLLSHSASRASVSTRYTPGPRAYPLTVRPAPGCAARLPLLPSGHQMQRVEQSAFSTAQKETALSKPAPMFSGMVLTGVAGFCAGRTSTSIPVRPV